MKKIIPYILILIVLTGIFSIATPAQAQAFICLNSSGTFLDYYNSADCATHQGIWTPTQAATGTCRYRAVSRDTPPVTREYEVPGVLATGCVVGTTRVVNLVNPVRIEDTTVISFTIPLDTPAPDPNQSAFEKHINAGCSIDPRTWFTGCLLKLFYTIFHGIPALLLAISGIFFNGAISLSINSDLTSSSAFLPAAWKIVRDLSNIFFILVLLYIAIKTILGLGGHDTKKMIAAVIVMALLINFSMFFTKVVIDSSNILALIFYNRVSVQTAPGVDRPYGDSASTGRKDLSGGMVSAFDPTRMLGEDFLTKAKVYKIPGVATVNEEKVPLTTLLGVILISAAVMLVAAYAFFIAAISFIGRLVELWVLVILSPFAFMSFTIPKLAGVEYLGWDSWVKRLLATAFMAPIFMFFMYLMFLMIRESNMFSGFVNRDGDAVQIILSIIIPAAIILILLLKATEFAKKGGGVIGEKLTGVGKAALGLAGGLALGAATGGAALAARAGIATTAAAGRATVGRAGTAVANSQWAKRLETTGTNPFAKFAGARIRDAGNIAAKSSFDVRGVSIAGKDLSSVTGLKLGKAQEGGYEKRKEDQVKKKQKRADELKVGENESLQQDVHEVEGALQNLLHTWEQELVTLDTDIKDAREELTDANAAYGANSAQAKTANAKLTNAKNKKKALREGQHYTGDVDASGRIIAGTNHGRYIAANAGTSTYIDANGATQTIRRTIKNMEKIEVRDKKQKVTQENRRRRRNYAESLTSAGTQIGNLVISLGQHSLSGNREAAHKIIMEEKIDSKGDSGH